MLYINPVIISYNDAIDKNHEELCLIQESERLKRIHMQQITQIIIIMNML